MATDDLLVRVRLIAAREGFSEKRMFGGNSFYLHGNMVCCVSKTGMMARVGKAQEEAALVRPGARPFTGTGRRMGGLVEVDLPHLEDDDTLEGWIAMALRNARSLPPKEKDGVWV
ncbi:TfoX/Sxy family protein [Kordiimonas aestuarii]|uniref:TfoX/Sxy family protein n=1 Tax=Kordiimonas aestuarii TaxID=1005925 RepID=UPI0021D1DCD2|nr:TfoX/Sxy family protein [Kordiimonas aestuarii]